MNATHIIFMLSLVSYSLAASAARGNEENGGKETPSKEPSDEADTSAETNPSTDEADAGAPDDEATPDDETAKAPVGGEATVVPITPPVLVVFKEAVYPAAALAERIEAEVILEIDIDAEGVVEGVSVLVPAEPEGMGFDEAASEAAFGFEFQPALEGETPVPVRITYKYRFALDEASEPPVNEAPEQSVSSSSPTETQPTAEFTGVLLELGTRLPIPGVTVIIFRGQGETASGFEATTDEDGKFSFVELEPGEWKVLAEPDGFFPLRTTETLVASERTQSKYYVEKGSYNPYDVLVEGERTRKEVSRTSISIEEAEKVPGTFGDVLSVVKNMPGVARTSPIGGNLVVRGSSPEDTKIYVDSVNVPLLYHFVGLKSVVPAGMLESIDFYPGNFSVYYGRATGGIVDVKLKNLNPEKVGGYVDVNLIDAGIYLEAPVTKKLAIAGGFRRSYFDGIVKQAASFGAPVNVVTAPRYYDFQLLARYRPTAKHELKTFFFGSDDRLVAVLDNPADLSPELRASEASTSTTFYRGIIEYDFMPTENVRNEFKTSFGRNWVYAGLGDQLYLDLNSYTAQIRDTLRVELADGLSVMGGVDYLFNKSDIAVKFPSFSKEGEFRSMSLNETIKFQDGKDLSNHSVGTYFELEAKLLERLTFIPGLRYDYFSRVDEGALSPRLTLRYALHDQWTLKGGVGLFYQEPSFDETSPIFGNPDLGLESAAHYSAGVEYRPLKQLSFDVTLFYKDLFDLVSRTSETVERDGEIVPLNFNNGGVGRVYGAELLIRHEPANNFSGWISYTLSRAERRDFGADDFRLFDHDQTHIFTAVGSYRLPKNWTIGLRYRLVSGRLYTPRIGSVYNADRASYEPIPGETNSRRMPMFHQLDLRIDKTWVFNNWMFTAYLDLQNAYNRANPEGYSYNVDSSEKRVRSGLPIIPIIGLKGEF
jgi:TonB family protein